jgi:uncharacterized membrane protein
MKTAIPALVLALLYFLFVFYVSISAAYLPDNFATSFNAAGEPECWMSRSSYMLFVLGMGTMGIIVMVAIGFVSRYMPDTCFSVSHREYWLAPERRDETRNYFFGQMIWFACLLTCFFIAVHFSTIHANKIEPVHLPQGEFLAIVGCFVAATLIWSLQMFLHFKRTS